MKKKLNLYIDGFNLFYGLKSLDKKYRWLDLMEVGRKLCRPGEELGEVKYFTARVTGKDKSKLRRQHVYLEALIETGVQITYGKFKERPQRCKVCGKTYMKKEEKESDVNLSALLLVDSAAKIADTMAVISGDSDLILPMQKSRDVYGRNVLPVFPPNRYSNEIKTRIGKHFVLGRNLLKNSQLPTSIKKANGYVLYRPKKWS